MFEWLPYNTGRLDRVPPDMNGRLAMIDHILRSRDGARAEKVAISGVTIPENAKCIEAFQICEYGRKPLHDELTSLFGLWQPIAQNITKNAKKMSQNLFHKTHKNNRIHSIQSNYGACMFTAPIPEIANPGTKTKTCFLLFLRFLWLNFFVSLCLCVTCKAIAQHNLLPGPLHRGGSARRTSSEFPSQSGAVGVSRVGECFETAKWREPPTLVRRLRASCSLQRAGLHHLTPAPRRLLAIIHRQVSLRCV